jgi:hypothetical protein
LQWSLAALLNVVQSLKEVKEVGCSKVVVVVAAAAAAAAAGVVAASLALALRAGEERTHQHSSAMPPALSVQAALATPPVQTPLALTTCPSRATLSEK